MTNTLPDFSLRPELALHARVVADVEAAAQGLGIVPLIAGAFARDLHLHYAHGIPIQRETADIDFAFAVPDWAAFTALRERLIASGAFEGSARTAHRLRHRNGWPLDLVPFGGVESPERRIIWPPQGEFVMDVFGFREALAGAQAVCCRARYTPVWSRLRRWHCSKLFAGKTGTMPLRARMPTICR